MSFMQTQAQFLARGGVTEADVAAYTDMLVDPSNVFLWPTVIATWGQNRENGL